MNDKGSQPYFDSEIFRGFLSNPDDADEKRQMLTLFNQQVMQYLSDLENAMVANHHINWRDSAHKLKGMCAFAGAVALRDLSEYAQNHYDCDQNHKRTYYDTIYGAAKETLVACNAYMDGL